MRRFALAGVALFAACSYRSVYLGVQPFPGRTGVPADTQVRIEVGRIADDAPAQGESYSLRGPTGEVPFSTRYDGQFLYLVPDEPLADGYYEVDGSPDFGTGANGHYHGSFLSGPPTTFARTSFQVSLGTPSAQGYSAFGDDALILVLTEDVVVSSVQVRVDGDPVLVRPGPERYTVLIDWNPGVQLDTGTPAGIPEVYLVEAMSERGEPFRAHPSVPSMDDCALGAALALERACF